MQLKTLTMLKRQDKNRIKKTKLKIKYQHKQ